MLGLWKIFFRNGKIWKKCDLGCSNRLVNLYCIIIILKEMRIHFGKGSQKDG